MSGNRAFFNLGGVDDGAVLVLPCDGVGGSGRHILSDRRAAENSLAFIALVQCYCKGSCDAVVVSIQIIDICQSFFGRNANFNPLIEVFLRIF